MCRIERNRQCALCLEKWGMGYRKIFTTTVNLEVARLTKTKGLTDRSSVHWLLYTQLMLHNHYKVQNFSPYGKINQQSSPTEESLSKYHSSNTKTLKSPTKLFWIWKTKLKLTKLHCFCLPKIPCSVLSSHHLITEQVLGFYSENRRKHWY